MKRSALVIAGPTASGKSALALDLAIQFGGEVINADAMQIYRDLKIVTARPSSQDTDRVPHHLYGTVDGADAWSAGHFARAAGALVDDILKRDRVPIVCGGTGLWIKALTDGLSPIPDVSEAIVDEARARLEEVGLTSFREEVLTADPAMAGLRPQDTQRHLRAWAVHRATGKGLSVWQSAPSERVTEADFLPFVLLPPREVLYARCNERFVSMMQSGAREEVEALLARGLSPHLPVMKAVGVPEIMGLLEGRIDHETCIAEAQQATRRLAKRQMTWLRGQTPNWPCYDDKATLMAAAVAARAV